MAPPSAHRKRRLLAAVTATGLLACASGAIAQEAWRARQVEASAWPPGIVAESRQPAPDGLPDGLVARHEGAGDITAAWYAAPTTRYRHGILGDATEAAGLVVETAKGARVELDLPSSEVFEDRYPRLADLDGDGTIEVIAIRSSVTRGASVTIYGLAGDALVERASTGFIGQANRWLNIAAIADFPGTGTRQIAFVRTPHIGGTLFVYRFAGGELQPLGALDGFSNHAIGSREMRLSAVADADGDGRPDLALPSADRKALRIVAIGEDGLAGIASVPLPARIDKAIAVRISGGKTRFVVGLDNGEVYEIGR